MKNQNHKQLQSGSDSKIFSDAYEAIAISTGRTAFCPVDITFATLETSDNSCSSTTSLTPFKPIVVPCQWIEGPLEVIPQTNHADGHNRIGLSSGVSIIDEHDLHNSPPGPIGGEQLSIT